MNIRKACLFPGTTKVKADWSIWNRRLFIKGFFGDHRLVNRDVSSTFSWSYLWCQGVWLLFRWELRPELTTDYSAWVWFLCLGRQQDYELMVPKGLLNADTASPQPLSPLCSSLCVLVIAGPGHPYRGNWVSFRKQGARQHFFYGVPILVVFWLVCSLFSLTSFLHFFSFSGRWMSKGSVRLSRHPGELGCWWGTKGRCWDRKVLHKWHSRHFCKGAASLS